MEDIEKLLSLLTSKNTSLACNAAKELATISDNSSFVNKYMDYFLSLLENDNSYVRNRALMLIGVNAKWDEEKILDAHIQNVLAHINDSKPITSRKCLECLMEVARYKEELRDLILEYILKEKYLDYPSSMLPLIKKDREKLVSFIEEIKEKRN